MVAETSRTNPDACYVLGRWDPSIQPTYTDVEGGTWTFRYDNGADDCGNPARTWAPTFVCSPGTIAEYEKVSEIPGSCYYELTVKTQYACVGQTYACPNVTNVCHWDIGNGQKLNLTDLQNKTLSQVSDGSDALQYLLTPCGNRAKCGNEGKFMANIVNLNNLECDKYLAKWDYDVKPSYNSELEQWKFVYNNGEKCNGEDNTFELFWNCDQSMKQDARIVAVKEVGGCTYQMYVNSSLACQ